jgi:hypothetical protein
MAPRLRSAVVRIHGLPELVLHVIMLALPVDARARAACVCRSWRALLADPSLWQVLDLTRAGGVARHRLTENLVRGAVARGAGQLRVLDLRADQYTTRVLTPLMFEVLRSDGAELQEVSSDGMLTVQDLEAVFAAAPRLQVLSTDVKGDCAALLPFLRNDPPYGPLRIKRLELLCGSAVPADILLTVAAAIAAHDSLKNLRVRASSYIPGMNALMDAAGERRLRVLSLYDCLDAGSVPALARVLQRGSLITLFVSCSYGFPHAEESMPARCAALRNSLKLKYLRLRLNPLHGLSRRIFTELLDAAAAMPALFVLNLNWSILQDTVGAGHALGALLRANLPSLRCLYVSSCHLGDEGMAAVLSGLEANAHLHKLKCRFGNNMSMAFERDRLAPALAVLKARVERYAQRRR